MEALGQLVLAGAFAGLEMKAGFSLFFYIW